MNEKTIHQDDYFVFDEFNGQKIERLIAVEVPENQSIAVVYIKVRNYHWHRFSLDVGFGIWTNCNTQTIDEDDSYNYIDKTREFELYDKEILQIRCEPLKNHCQIIIEFVSGEKIILKPFNPDDWESKLELIIK